MLVSVLQHPLGAAAPAPTNDKADRSPPSHPLGLVPHQMRGFLTNFQNIVIKGHSYDCCSACSKPIVEAYEKGGWAFVKRALNEKGFVEEVSGLAEVQRRAAELEMADWGESGDEDGEM
jgi:ubiquitin-like modifier-activating enzyme ATG7